MKMQIHVIYIEERKAYVKSYNSPRTVFHFPAECNYFLKVSNMMHN